MKSSLAVNTPIKTDSNDAPKFSAGHSEHQWTPSTCMESLFQYLDHSYNTLQANIEEEIERNLGVLIRKQIEKMQQASSSQGKLSVSFRCDQNNYTANVFDILGDGNCLYTAISHQIDPNNVNATKMREDITHELETNSSNRIYFKALVNHLVETMKETEATEFHKNSVEKQGKRVKELIDSLKCERTYGGGESIIAAGILFGSNVLTISHNEHNKKVKSSVKLDYFDKKNERIILLAYDPTTKHYDSVVEFQEPAVIDRICAQIRDYRKPGTVELT